MSILRLTLCLVGVAVLSGCAYRIERGPLLDDVGPQLEGGEWQHAVEDAVDVRWARSQALAYFKAPIRRRLEEIPIFLSRCQSPELAGAYCQGGLVGLVSCGSTDEEIDLFYSPSRELSDWRRTIDEERRGLPGAPSAAFYTATLWFSGIIHRRVHFPLDRSEEALERVRDGLRDVLVAILVHEYFHALAANGSIDMTAITDRIEDQNPEIYPISRLVATGRDAYPWWVFLHGDEEAACLTAEYHLVFGYEVPPEVARSFADVIDGRRGVRTPIIVRIGAEEPAHVALQPER